MRAVRDRAGRTIGYYERYAPPLSGEGAARSASDWVARLGLAPHPEGGCFRETWRAGETIAADALPKRFGGDRSLGSAILFLIGPGERSHLHRLAADEVWHHYEGADLALHLIHPDRRHEEIRIGPGAERFQATAPAGVWFGALPVDPESYSLTGCTLAPGFHFEDFEMAGRAPLLAEYPEHAAVIEKLTR
ncbi:MAG: cupin domain-containing protein [Candidatus Eisenbacteria bacterium]|nr:cupin domain-containing protein [Candidatus Eisenbacteria bacterium]